MSAFLTIYVIYDHPRDYPDHFVLRRQYVVKPGDTLPDGAIAMAAVPGVALDLECVLAESLDAIRRVVPRGMTRMPPDADDDSAIAEVWV